MLELISEGELSIIPHMTEAGSRFYIDRLNRPDKSFKLTTQFADRVSPGVLLLPGYLPVGSLSSEVRERFNLPHPPEAWDVFGDDLGAQDAGVLTRALCRAALDYKKYAQLPIFGQNGREWRGELKETKIEDLWKIPQLIQNAPGKWPFSTSSSLFVAYIFSQRK